MFKDITLGQYVPGESPIHRMDPRVKITITFTYIVILFFIRDLRAYSLLGSLTLATALIASIPIRMLIRGLRPVLFIIFITFFLNMLVTPGDVAYAIGPLTITEEGLRQGITMVFRLLLLILTTSILTLTTSPIDLTDGLESIMRPGQRVGVPAHELAMMMTIALRFIPTLMEEADRIMKAQMARGADFSGGNLIKRAKSLIPLLVPLFVGAFRRADDLAMAMEARCYRGGEGRTRYRQLSITAVDYHAALVSLLVIGFALAWGRGWITWL